jgi:hypothetical protein
LVSAGLTILVLMSLQPKTTVVVVTKGEIQPFTPLTAVLLTEVRVDAATAGRLFPDAYASAKDLVGKKVAFRKFRSGEVLLKSEQAIADPAHPEKLKTSAVPLAARVKTGYAAVSIQASNPGAVAGDFVLLFRVKQGDVRPVLSQAAQVVTEQGTSLLLMVREEDVNEVLKAQAEGQLQTVLAGIPK